MKHNRKRISIYNFTGSFAEDKDIARKIREELVRPSIKIENDLELDFDKVEDVTQSFIHALLSELIRDSQGEVLDHVFFKNCNETVQKIINIVVEYMIQG